MFKKAGSSIKEEVLFRGAYHELQKEPEKNKLYAKVISFTYSLLKHNSSPVGVINGSKLRHGLLPKRKPQGSRFRMIMLIVGYLIIGIAMAIKVFPKGNKLRVILVWPLLTLVRILIGKMQH